MYCKNTNILVIVLPTLPCSYLSSFFLLSNRDQQPRCKGPWRRGADGVKNMGPSYGLFCTGLQTPSLMWTTLASVEAWMCWQEGCKEHRGRGRFTIWSQKEMERKLCSLLLRAIAPGWTGLWYLAICSPSSLFLFSPGIGLFPFYSRSFRETSPHSHA